jgi:hypothetical protein
MNNNYDIWATYAPKKVRKALRKSDGTLEGVDSAALKQDLHSQRKQDSQGRPAS